MKNKISCLIAALLFIVASGFSQNAWKDVYSEQAWTQRDSWQRPQEIVKLLQIGPGSSVADIGCHEGYFTIKLANVVGSTGTVYAVDISREKVEKVKENASKRNLHNVKAIVGATDDPKLPGAALDAILIVDTYHEMKAHQEILGHCKTALKPGGRLVICEPISEARKILTRDEQTKKHELGLAFAVADLKSAGFKIALQREDFVDRVKEKGDTMWVIVAVKENL